MPKPGLPTDPDDVVLLLDMAIIQKAAYEVRYEIGHRPDWVMIPFCAEVAAVNEQGLAEAIRQSVWSKWEGHEINAATFVKPDRTMHAIGG